MITQRSAQSHTQTPHFGITITVDVNEVRQKIDDSKFYISQNAKLSPNGSARLIHTIAKYAKDAPENTWDYQEFYCTGRVCGNITSHSPIYYITNNKEGTNSPHPLSENCRLALEELKQRGWLVNIDKQEKADYITLIGPSVLDTHRKSLENELKALGQRNRGSINIHV